MAESDLYGIRCENCDCSFAPGTKQCVHCGGPLGTGLMAALRAASGEHAGQIGAQGEVGAEGEISGEDEKPTPNKLWIVMAILGLGFSMLRQCA